MKIFKIFQVFFLLFFLLFSTSNALTEDEGLKNWAIVSNYDNGTISIVDVDSMTSYGPFFDGIFSDEDIFEVKVTPDGKKALVAEFYSEKVHFIDLTNPISPVYIGSVDTPGLWAENIAISPNGKCAVIGDGFGSDVLHVINIDTMSVSQTLTVNQVMDVSMSPDGQIVVVSEYYNGEIHILSFDQTNCSISDTGQYFDDASYPINSEFSQDGKTLIVVSDYSTENVHIFEVNGSSLTFKNSLDLDCSSAQSVAIYGNKAYVYCNGASPDELAVLNINGPGDVNDTNIRITLNGNGPSYVYFGVNQVAVTLDGKYALVSHQASENFVSVVDLNTNSLVGSITTDNNAISVATIPIYNVPSVQNGKMYGNFSVGNWPNTATVNSQIPCSDVGGAYTMFTMNWIQNGRYNYVTAYNKDSVVCYDDPSFDPMKPNVDFDTTIATLTGMMNYSTPVTIEVEMSDGGEPGLNKDYVHITVKDMSNTTIFEIDGMVTSGSVYATPLY